MNVLKSQVYIKQLSASQRENMRTLQVCLTGSVKNSISPTSF